jgi:AAHS family 3-hydroxyphenylpropionic acid transporter
MSSTSRTGTVSAAVVVAFCCLAFIGEGFGVQLPGVTMPVLAPLFKLTTGAGGSFLDGFLSQKSLFLSMSTFGLLVGAIVGGRLSDRYGRKWVAVTSVALFGLISAVTANSVSADMLLWCRFFAGLGLGGALPNLIAIVAENVSPERRNTALGCLYGSMPTGGALVSLSSYLFANPTQWPTIYYIGSALPLLAVPGLIFGVPNVKPGLAAEAKTRPSVPAALFGDSRVLSTLVLWVGFFFALITMYILLGWLPSLLIGKGLSKPEASIVQIGFNVFGAVGSILTGMLIDRPGRAVGLVFLSAIVSLGILAGAPATLGISFVVGSLVGCTISGTQTILYALAPSCYPTHVRGTGVGFAVAVGRFGSIVGPLLAGAMLGAGASPARVLAALAPIMIVAGIAAVFIGAKTQPVGKAVAGPALVAS